MPEDGTPTRRTVLAGLGSSISIGATAGVVSGYDHEDVPDECAYWEDNPRIRFDRTSPITYYGRREPIRVSGWIYLPVDNEATAVLELEGDERARETYIGTCETRYRSHFVFEVEPTPVWRPGTYQFTLRNESPIAKYDGHEATETFALDPADPDPGGGNRPWDEDD